MGTAMFVLPHKLADHELVHGAALLTGDSLPCALDPDFHADIKLQLYVDLEGALEIARPKKAPERLTVCLPYPSCSGALPTVRWAALGRAQ